MRTLKNFATLLFENSFKMFLGFFLNVYIARTLGPEGIGSLSYILTFGMIFLPFFSLGTEDWFFAKISAEKNEERLNEFLGTSFLIRLIGPFVGFSLCLISIFLFNKNDELSIFIILYSLFMSFKAFDNINVFFIAKEDFRLMSFLRNIAYIILTGLKFGAIYLTSRFQEVIYLSCFEFLFFAFIYVFVFKYKGRSFSSWKVSKSILQTAIKLSWPLTALAFINVAIIRIDQIMIGNMLSKADLGQYSIVSKILEIFQFLPIVILTVLLPKVLSSEENYSKSKNLVVFLILFISLIFSVLITSSSEYLIPLLFGEKFIYSGVIFKIYAWQSIFFFVFLARQKFLIAEENTFPSLVYGSLSLINNIILNYFWIKEYQLIGAIYASITAFFLTELLFILISQNFRKEYLELLKCFNIVRSYNHLKALMKDS